MLVKRKSKFKKTWYFLNVSLAFIALTLLTFLIVGFVSKNSLTSPLGRSESKIEILKSELKKNNIEFQDIVPDTDNSYKVVLKNTEVAYISNRKDLAVQARSLQLMLSRLTIDGKSFKAIDLRFNSPLVIFK